MNMDPTIAFSSEDNSYLIAWTEYDFKSPGQKESNIVGRKLDDKGKLVGKKIQLAASDKGYDEYPYLISSTIINPSPASSRGYKLIWYYLNRYSSEDKTGLWAVNLDADGKQAGEANLVFGSPSMDKRISDIYVAPAAEGRRGGIIVPFLVYYTDDSSGSYMVEVKANSSSGKSLELADTILYGLSLSRLSKKLYMYNWKAKYESDIFHRFLTKHLKKKMSPFRTKGNYRYSFSHCLNNSNGGCHFIIACDFTASIYYFDSKGNQSEKIVTEELSRFCTSKITCTRLPDGKFLLVSCGQVEEAGDLEIIGYVLNLE
jgi:hypothetical protein